MDEFRAWCRDVLAAGGCTDVLIFSPEAPRIGGRYFSFNERSANTGCPETSDYPNGPGLKPGDLVGVWVRGVRSPAVSYSREMLDILANSGISPNDWGYYFSNREDWTVLFSRAQAARGQTCIR